MHNTPTENPRREVLQKVASRVPLDNGLGTMDGLIKLRIGLKKSPLAQTVLDYQGKPLITIITKNLNTQNGCWLLSPLPNLQKGH
jgi:hypothetical protein